MSTLNIGGQLIENTDYSTGEVKTGARWIDGKPIYRRVHITTTFTKTTGTNRSLYTSAGTKINDVDTMIDIEAVFKVNFNGSTRSLGLGTADIIDVATTGVTYTSAMTYRHDNGDFFGTFYTKGTFVPEVYQLIAIAYYTKTS